MLFCSGSGENPAATYRIAKGRTEGHRHCGVDLRDGVGISRCKSCHVRDSIASSPSTGLGAGIDGGWVIRLCWISFAAKILSLFSMAALGFLLQEVGANTSPVFRFSPRAFGLLC